MSCSQLRETWYERRRDAPPRGLHVAKEDVQVGEREGLRKEARPLGEGGVRDAHVLIPSGHDDRGNVGKPREKRVQEGQPRATRQKHIEEEAVNTLVRGYGIECRRVTLSYYAKHAVRLVIRQSASDYSSETTLIVHNQHGGGERGARTDSSL